MRTPIKFVAPFDSREDVRKLIEERAREKGDDLKEANPISRSEATAAGKGLVHGIDVMNNLRLVYRWKMRRFRWTKGAKAFLAMTLNPSLERALSKAREAIQNPLNQESSREALEIFTDLPGVRVPVASAFLTAMDPHNFTIIDRRAFRALNAPFRAKIADYIDYLWFCRADAKRLGVDLNDYDQALWQKGKNSN
jgi:hypothetical protein